MIRKKINKNSIKKIIIAMEKIIDLIKTNWPFIVGGLTGGVGGYIYWYKIGCSTGSCPITSSPVMSIIWGSVLGALLLSMVFPTKKRPETGKKEK
jgi:hypothetical protein